MRLAKLAALRTQALRLDGTGRDSYRAIFIWYELFNSSVGAAVFVLCERDGRPLDSHLNPLSLKSAQIAEGDHGTSGTCTHQRPTPLIAQLPD
jgi:hypothetical protein